MKPLRLTSPAITKILHYRIYLDRFRISGREIAKEISVREKQIKKYTQPFLAAVQAKLDEVNGRARSRTIADASVLCDLAIGIEIELRVRGVSIESMKKTKVHYIPKSGFKNVTTSVKLERRASGWFATNIERASTYNGKHIIRITPQAAADIVNFATNSVWRLL